MSIDPWGCGNTSPLESSTILQAGQWYCVTGTYDGLMAMIYVDGQLKNIGVRTLDSYYPNFYVGANYSDYNNEFFDHFDGKIDDVRIYDRAFSGEEVEELYEGGL